MKTPGHHSRGPRTAALSYEFQHADWPADFAHSISEHRRLELLAMRRLLQRTSHTLNLLRKQVGRLLAPAFSPGATQSTRIRNGASERRHSTSHIIGSANCDGNAAKTGRLPLDRTERVRKSYESKVKTAYTIRWRCPVEFQAIPHLAVSLVALAKAFVGK